MPDQFQLPTPGTPAYNTFMLKARDPNSLEASVLRQAMGKAQDDASAHVREMLNAMIQLAPGRLFRDVSIFHEKFELKATEDPGHRLSDDLLMFRLKFLVEELQEYAEAVGFELNWSIKSTQTAPDIEERKFNAEQALDSLADLCYIALGTAYLHRFDKFDSAWERIQAANLQKVRAEKSSDSKRGSTWDVIKPPSWVHPDLKDLL